MSESRLPKFDALNGGADATYVTSTSFLTPGPVGIGGGGGVGGEFKIYDLDVYGENFLELSRASSYFRKRSDFRGHQLKWGYPWAGRNVITEEAIRSFREGPSPPNSYVAAVMAFTKYLNATLAPSRFYRIHGVPDPTTKSFNGLYGGLESGEVHIALWMLNQGFYEEILSTTSDGIQDGLVFFTSLKKNLGNADPIVTLFEQLDLTIIAYHVGCIALIVVTIVIAKPREKWIQAEIWFSTLAGICRLIPQQNINQEIEKQLAHGKIKLVLGPWLLSLILLSSDMQSVIVSSLSTTDFAFAPRSFEELVSSKFKISFFGNDTVADKAIRNLAREEGRESFFGKISAKIESTYNYVDVYLQRNCFSRMRIWGIVCMGTMQPGLQNAYQSLVSKSGEILFLQSTDVVFPVITVLHFSKLMDHLQGKI
ncbi:uncharacterized protein LOC118437315 [Folsomia candida]|uniref:uncharacterized protein LOC118437315 n=1 Tax=Folsomia candida TaxID=158441 RepID=UPI001604AF99|nr:uncharacterized protein LOC118437315 [Folsomia candida]